MSLQSLETIPIDTLWRGGSFFYRVKDLLKLVRVSKNKKITMKQFKKAIIEARANTQCLFVDYFNSLYFVYKKNLYITIELLEYFDSSFRRDFNIF